MKLAPKQIEEIAEELECGMKVYLNIETLEIKIILDWDENYFSDQEEWEDDIKDIEYNPANQPARDIQAGLMQPTYAKGFGG